MEYWQLKQKQMLSMKSKVRLSEKRIEQFYDHYDGDVYVSFSGGKDSTVLLDIVRSLYPKVPAVFVDTGLEYPEIKEFVKTIDNVTWLRPKMPFTEVIKKYGYPVVSKQVARYNRDIVKGSDKLKTLRLTGITSKGVKSKCGKQSLKWLFLKDAPFKISEQCCDVMKKSPIKSYVSKTKTYPFTGEMTGESRMRMATYLKNGCNAFDLKTPKSTPLAFWNEEDIWEYIKTKELPYATIYDTGVQRTGCMFCMFGVHMEKSPNRFQLMQKSHPKLWDYCINKLGCGEVLDYIGVGYKQEEDLWTNIQE